MEKSHKKWYDDKNDIIIFTSDFVPVSSYKNKKNEKNTKKTKKKHQKHNEVNTKKKTLKNNPLL